MPNNIGEFVIHFCIIIIIENFDTNTSKLIFFLHWNKFYLLQVALIFGLAGACRTLELTDLKINNCQDLEKELTVTIPDTKTHTSRSFAILANSYNYYNISLHLSRINYTYNTPILFELPK